MIRICILLLALLFIQSCSLFGRTTVVHDRLPIVTLPEPPQLKPDDGTVERWNENYSAIAEYAIRITRGVHVYNEYAFTHNVEYGYFKAEESTLLRKTYRMPPIKNEVPVVEATRQQQ